MRQEADVDLIGEFGPRLAAGGRLSDAEIDRLADTHDLLSLGMLADEARRRRHDDRATFVRVATLTGDAGQLGATAVPAPAREVRLVLSPDSIDAAVTQVQRAARLCAGRPLTGFALDRLASLCGGRAGDLERGLVALRTAGLDLVSELALDRAHDAEAMLAAASAAGIGIARATVHRAGYADALRLFRQVRDWGLLAAPIRSLAPLAREPVDAPATGYDDVRQVALARLIVDNIASIQVDWALYGPKLAQVALAFGADDLDNVSPLDTLDLGARRAPLEEARRNIMAASLVPVERNGRFERVDS